MKTARFSNWQSVLGFIFSLIIIAYMLRALDWQATLYVFMHVNYFWLLLSLVFYLLNYALRTIRFRYLLNLQKIPFTKLFGVTSLYGMYLYLMPAKLGEVSYPVLLKKELGISIALGSTTLIVARFWDFLVVSLFLPFVVLFFRDKMALWLQVGSLVFFIVVIFVGFAALWIMRSHTTKTLEARKPFNFRWAVYALNFINKLLIGFREIDSRRQNAQIGLLTLAIWICIQANFYSMIRGLGYSLNLFEIAVILIIMIPVTLFPIQGFGNLGTHEVGWVTAFSLFGYSQPISLTIAVSTHIILLALVLLLGLLGFIILNLQ